MLAFPVGRPDLPTCASLCTLSPSLSLSPAQLLCCACGQVGWAASSASSPSLFWIICAALAWIQKEWRLCSTGILGFTPARPHYRTFWGHLWIPSGVSAVIGSHFGICWVYSHHGFRIDSISDGHCPGEFSCCGPQVSVSWLHKIHYAYLKVSHSSQYILLSGI